VWASSTGTGLARSGKRYGAWAVTGAIKCALHADPGRAAELGSKRGRRVKFRPRPDALDLRPRPLKRTEEVCELLEETINLVRRGSLDVRAANSIGVLAGILLRALDQRVESPETTNSEASPGIYMSLFQRLAGRTSTPCSRCAPRSCTGRRCRSHPVLSGEAWMRWFDSYLLRAHAICSRSTRQSISTSRNGAFGLRKTERMFARPPSSQ
jgi:hypothetical protein